MSEHADVALIHEVNAAVGRRDWHTISSRLHPDVVWEQNLGGGSPEEGVYRGRDSVVQLFERIVEPWEYMRPEPLEIHELGRGRYDVRGELHMKHATSTVEMVSPYAQRFEIREGVLTTGSMATATAGLIPNNQEEKR